MRFSLNCAGILFLGFFQAQAATNSWYYDTKGPQFQYDRFRTGCFNLHGNTGRNPGYVGECGDLRQADLSNKNFKSANFNGADLRGAQFQNSDFTSADLRAADLRFSNWENTQFSRALVNTQTQLPFDAVVASKLGLLSTKYDELDRQLSSSVGDWLKAPGVSVPDSVASYLSLDADYFYNSGNLIHQSLNSCNLFFVDYLIKNRHFPVNGTYPYFRPYLESAMKGCSDPKKNLAQVQYLLAQGVDPNLALESDPPLWTAVFNGYHEVAQALIQAGAKIDTERNGTNLIALAAINKRASLLPLLVGAGLDVNNCKNQGKPCSALEYAISKKDDAAIQYLLSVKADASVSYDLPSLLDYFDDIESLDLFINAGANVKTASVHHRLNGKTIEYLVQKGADINTQDAQGETLLHKSVKNQRPQLVELALKLKANVNLKTNDGVTAFSWTFQNEASRKLWFQKFLDLGADPNVPLAVYDHFGGQIRIRSSVDAVLSTSSNFFDRLDAYFMPMARAGLKLNEIQKEASATNAIRFILQTLRDGGSTLPERLWQNDMKELQKLGADFSIPLERYEIRRPTVEISTDDYSYSVRNEERVRENVSLAFLMGDHPGFLETYSSLGYPILGSQNSRGDSLIFNWPYERRLEHFASLGIPLGTLNREGQNLYFYTEDTTWNFLKSKNVPFLTEDKEGNSLLAFVPGELCSPKLLDNFKEVIAKGANARLVSKTYNLSLVQLILSKIKTENDIACAKALLSGLRNDQLEFNLQWNMKSRDGKIIPGYGAVRLMLSAGNYGLAKDLEINESVQAKYLDLIQFMVSKGYKPELEESFVSPQYSEYKLLNFAYDYHFMNLVKFLKSRGIKDPPYRYEENSRYTPPANACESFPKSKAHKPFGQGCLSTVTGLIWSVSEKVTGTMRRENHGNYCSRLKGDWRVPSMSLLMMEHFTKTAKPGLFAYSDFKNPDWLFDLAKGQVKVRTGEKQEFNYICVMPVSGRLF